jgi:CRP-like cAMP-binding protein
VLSLLGDFRRLETAETITEARVLGFFRPDLKNVMRRNPKAAAEITMAMARYVAAQHVEAIRLIEERDGRDAALDTYAEAAARLKSEFPSPS